MSSMPVRNLDIRNSEFDLAAGLNVTFLLSFQKRGFVGCVNGKKHDKRQGQSSPAPVEGYNSKVDKLETKFSLSFAGHIRTTIF